MAKKIDNRVSEKDQVLRFMAQKNTTIYQVTGIYMISNDDFYDLKHNWKPKEYNDFLWNMSKHSLPIVKEYNKGDERDCWDCFSTSNCNTRLCPIKKSVINDTVICPWCDKYNHCGDCSFGHRHGICSYRDSMYERVCDALSHVQSECHDRICALPEIQKLFSRTVYNYLTGEEI